VAAVALENHPAGVFDFLVSGEAVSQANAFAAAADVAPSRVARESTTLSS